MFATVFFEIWNRRTYPIILEGSQVKFRQDILEASSPSLDRETNWWVDNPSHCSNPERLVVKNGEHHSFELVVPIKKGQMLDRVDGMIEIEVTCFDPRRERDYKLNQKYRYFLK